MIMGLIHLGTVRRKKQALGEQVTPIWDDYVSAEEDIPRVLEGPEWIPASRRYLDCVIERMILSTRKNWCIA